MSLSLDTLSQIGITLFGIGAIVLVARKNKWGFVLGLLSQPFWFTTAFLNDQWGIMAINLIYAGTWTYGIYNWFWKDKGVDNIAENG